MFVLAATVACSPPEPPAQGARSAERDPAAEPCLLSAQTYIHAPYDSVWHSLTSPERFAAWHSAPGIKFGSAVGDSVTWGAEDGPLHVGVLRSYDPGEGFAHTFSFTFVRPAEETLVRWDVVPQGEVVYVRVRHDCAGASLTEGVITEVGWAKSLARLKSLLETGTAMPWPEDGGRP